MGSFDQAQADLVAMEAQIVAADGQAASITASAFGQVSVTGSAYAQPVQTYQSAGAMGTSTIGPEIDAAGPAATTQPYTQAAAKLGAELAKLPTSGRSNTQGQQDAALASNLARQMLTLYRQAIASATAAAAAPSPPAPATGGGGSGGGASSPSSAPPTTQVATAALGWKAILVAYGQMHPGQAPPMALQFALAQAIGEGSFSGYFRGTNNFGAMHASAGFAAKHANDPGYGTVAFLDHAPAPYITEMAVYPSLALGALAFLHLLEAELGGDFAAASGVQDYAARLYVHNYYGGFHTPRTPLSQRAAAYAGGTWNAADTANIAEYAALIQARLPAAQAAINAAPGVTSDPTLASSGVFASLGERLTPGPRIRDWHGQNVAGEPHTVEHAREILGPAADRPPPGTKSLAECLSPQAGGQGVWMFAQSQGATVLPAPKSGPVKDIPPPGQPVAQTPSDGGGSVGGTLAAAIASAIVTTAITVAIGRAA